jgi:hypothetical protein
LALILIYGNQLALILIYDNQLVLIQMMATSWP